MIHVVWNPQTKENLTSIKAYHEEARVKKIINGIISATDHSTPAQGGMIPKIGDPNFREVIWKNWAFIHLLPKSQENRLKFSMLFITLSNSAQSGKKTTSTTPSHTL